MSAPAVNLRLRPMLEEDLPAVLALEQQAYSHPWSLGMLRDCLRGDYQCQLLEGPELIGYAVTAQVLEEGQILNLCISPRHQGHGYGRELLQRLLQGLREDGVERVLLEVRESNQVAHKLYQSGGFRVVGQRRGYYPSGQGREDAKVMLLDLY